MKKIKIYIIFTIGFVNFVSVFLSGKEIMIFKRSLNQNNILISILYLFFTIISSLIIMKINKVNLVADNELWVDNLFKPKCQYSRYHFAFYLFLVTGLFITIAGLIKDGVVPLLGMHSFLIGLGGICSLLIYNLIKK